MADPAADPFAQYDTSAPAPANNNAPPAAGPGLQVTSTPTAVGAVSTQTVNGQVFAFNPATGKYDLPTGGGSGTSGAMAPPATPVAPTSTPIDVHRTPQADPFAKYETPAAPTPAATPAATPATPAPAAPAATPGTAQAATVAPPAVAAASPGAPAWQPIKDAIQAVVNSLGTVPPEGSGPLGTPPIQGSTGALQHGFTLGLDEILAPLIPAAAESAATGKPFSQVYDDVVQQMREPRHDFEEKHPYAAGALNLAGAAAAPPIFRPLFSGAPAASALGTAANAVRNVAAGTAAGGATGFTMADGDVNQRMQGAKQGAEAGGVLSAVAPLLVGGAQRIYSAVRPSTQIDPLAGQILREQAGLKPGDPVPVPQTSPVKGMPLGSGPAFNNPGLAAQERLLNTTDDAGAAAQVTRQNAALRDAATTRQPSGVRLANPMSPAEASVSVTKALQNAHAILNSEEDRLWNAPPLLAVKPDVPALVTRVQRAIAALPQRYQNAMTKQSDVYAAIQDLYNLKPGASLADINSVRSDILAASRALPFTERFAKAAADRAAKAVLDAIESNPAIRAAPDVSLAYQRARDFTRNMWTALEKPQFQKMLQATENNRKGIDPGTTAAGMFNFGAGTEKTPQGLKAVTDMLDGIRRTWGSLATGNAGVPLPGLSPAAAFAARAELAQGARDFVVNSMLDAATSNVRDQGDAQRLLMNRLSDWVDTNKGWMARSGMFSQPQIDLLNNIRDASVMAQRLQNLRGGTGSETHERLMGNHYIDVFLGPLLGTVMRRGIGAAGGALTEHLAPGWGIGALIGLELVGSGSGTNGLLARLYSAPRQALQARIAEAIRDPQIAEDLMKEAGQRVSPQTKAWARSLLAILPASEAATTMPPGTETVH